MTLFTKVAVKLTKSINLSKALPLLVMLFAISAVPTESQAVQIQDTSAEIREDFVLEPARVEVVLQPGETVTRELSIVNRMSTEQTFFIEVEDFVGTRDPKNSVRLLGNETGPYTLKDNLVLEEKSFSLKPSQRGIIQVTISAPQNAEPGGKYASVLVSNSSPGNTGESGARTISRVGALYLVKVEGDVNENGKLTDFKLTGAKKPFYEKGPFNFEILFENNGSIHLTPGGTIEIKNTLGRKVTDIAVPQFFSLPDSLRGAEAVWNSPFAFGRYTATATIDRGYRESVDVTDTISISFWVLPWKILVGVIVIILLVAFILRKILNSFEIKRKD